MLFRSEWGDVLLCFFFLAIWRNFKIKTLCCLCVVFFFPNRGRGAEEAGRSHVRGDYLGHQDKEETLWDSQSITHHSHPINTLLKSPYNAETKLSSWIARNHIVIDLTWGLKSQNISERYLNVLFLIGYCGDWRSKRGEGRSWTLCTCYYT